jgi:tRNA nucleotidyltransferase (CCA-adding enzyme)
MKIDFKEFDAEYKKIVERVIRELKPPEEEVKRGLNAKRKLEKRLAEVLKDYPEIEYSFLGSFARNTWLKGSLEIDLFLLFPEEYMMDVLEKVGLEIGKKVVDEWDERYASHPYIHGYVDGVEVDVVPCYKLERVEKIKSAVDRTPFHHKWVKNRIKGLEDEVRLLKSFLKSGGIYGAEYSVRGFSGYLCELLIIHYGSFNKLVKRACRWKRGLKIDVMNKKELYDKNVNGLFVIDPVDSRRNVSANLSLNNLAKFVERCRDFVLSPSERFFFPERVKEISKRDIETEIERRASGIYAVEFEKPNIVEDNLHTQLEKARKKIHEFLEKSEFMPLNSDYFVLEKCVLIFETQVRRLSNIKKVIGPPFEEWEHSKRFRDKKRDYSTFLEEGRYYAYEIRSITNPKTAIEWYIHNFSKSLGKNVSEEIERGFKIYEGVDVLKIDGVKNKLANFLKLKP